MRSPIVLAIALALSVGCAASLPQMDSDFARGTDISISPVGLGIVEGDAVYTATHDGAAYYFASQESADRFSKDPEGYLPRYGGFCAYAVALGYAKHHSRALEEDLRAAHRAPPSRTKLENIGKRLGTQVDEHAPRIESYLRQGERVPDGAVSISVGLDRTAVPLEEERAADQPPKTRRKKRTKPYERAPPPPVDVNYHMAYIGTVSFTDEEGDVLLSRRYAVSHEADPDDIIRRMMADVRNARRRRVAGMTALSPPRVY